MEGFIIPLPQRTPDLRQFFMADLERVPDNASEEVKVEHQLSALRKALTAGFGVEHVAESVKNQWGEGPTRRSDFEGWGLKLGYFRRAGQVHRFIEDYCAKRRVGNGEIIPLTRDQLIELHDRAVRVIESMHYVNTEEPCPIHGTHEVEDVFDIDTTLASDLLPNVNDDRGDGADLRLWGATDYLGPEYRVDLVAVRDMLARALRLDPDAVHFEYLSIQPGYEEMDSTELTL